MFSSIREGEKPGGFHPIGDQINLYMANEKRALISKTFG
jgi:hypothetical protein